MIMEEASVEDAQEILDLQKVAYWSEAELYNDFTIPPLLQTLDQMRDEFASRLVLKVSDEGKIVGSVRGYLDGRTCHIGRLIVHPGLQNRGIGTRLMVDIEERFPEADRYELFTGHLSERNLRLYRRLGYEIIAEKAVTDTLTLVFMEKSGNP
jgi:ribosomal protein S18 acetylase RimI-like enzyme